MSWGLSTVNINNSGNSLLLLKSIPVLLLLLSAGPGPKNRYDEAQMKQAKWNESRGKKAVHPSAPHEFKQGCPKPKKHENQIPVESPPFSPVCYRPGAGRSQPQCRSPVRSMLPPRQSCLDTGKWDWRSGKDIAVCLCRCLPNENCKGPKCLCKAIDPSGSSKPPVTPLSRC